MAEREIQTVFRFEWDPRKDTVNLRKHGVGFQEAASVFADANQASVYDEDHSRGEDRWITLGLSERGRLLVLCHTFRQSAKGEAAIRVSRAERQQRRKLGSMLELDESRIRFLTC